MQGGKCMYTGEPIDIDELMGKNSRWDIDHIYPQSKIKDDSIHNNRVLANKNYNNNIKGSKYPIPASTREKMRTYWQYLLDKKLITAEKYNRLICRNPLTDEQLSAFINRQLVETQQSTKAIADILGQLYPSPETEIVYVKSRLVSEFRQKNDMIKSRDVNDMHHAKDAYLNIVVGNVYNVQCTHNKANFIKGLQSDERDSYSLNGMFNFNIKGAWDKNTSMATVKKYMNKNNILYTRYSYKQKGGLFDQQPLKKGSGQVPLKASVPRNKTEKYGAYGSATTYCYCVAKHGKTGKEKIGLFAINLYEKDYFSTTPEKYLEKQYKLVNPIILIKEVNIQSCLSFDGFRVHLGGKDSGGKNVVYRPAIQLALGYEWELYVKAIFKFFETNKAVQNPKIDLWDGLDTERNLSLYCLIAEKLCNSVFKVLYNDLGNKMVEKTDVFKSLPIEKQCQVLREIINILHCNARGGDLKDIEITSNGKIRKGCNISENGFDCVKLINQSVTGLYEHSIELLKM